MTHTPGPWTWDMRAPEGKPILVRPVILADDGLPVAAGVRSQEDARLIAAAPDLLEVAERIEAQTYAFITAWEMDHGVDGEKLMEDLKAAIAKAKGETL